MDGVAESHVAAALVGILPVAVFLAVLVMLDSYKLVRLRTVMMLVACGFLAAAIAYLLHAAILDRVPMRPATLSRYVAPLTEEVLKGLIIAVLIRAHRIGFLVDAAIAGFAVGTGFAILENVHYLRLSADAGIGTWVVRGFGTSLMHGGASAIFAVAGLALAQRQGRAAPASFLPGFAIAAALHSAFNHFFASPFVSSLGIVVVLPLLLIAVFERSGRAMGEWLGKGFDADSKLLALLESGSFSSSPTGKYLHELSARFEGPVVADILCYLRLHTELALRAKGLLLMRENGFDAPVDPETRARFAEMHYLERSIGRTGLLAIQPMLVRDSRELWQLYMLGK